MKKIHWHLLVDGLVRHHRALASREKSISNKDTIRGAIQRNLRHLTLATAQPVQWRSWCCLQRRGSPTGICHSRGGDSSLLLGRCLKLPLIRGGIFVNSPRVNPLHQVVHERHLVLDPACSRPSTIAVYLCSFTIQAYQRMCLLHSTVDCNRSGGRHPVSSIALGPPTRVRWRWIVDVKTFVYMTGLLIWVPHSQSRNIAQKHLRFPLPLQPKCVMEETPTHHSLLYSLLFSGDQRSFGSSPAKVQM